MGEVSVDNEKNVIRLAKPVKKGLGSFIFSRLFLVIALLLIQVVILIALWLWATNKYPALLALYWVFTFVMVIYLFNNNMDASAKLSWMLILSLLPAAGALYCCSPNPTSDTGKKRSWLKGRSTTQKRR